MTKTPLTDGYTLVELLVVLAIVSLMAAIAAPLAARSIEAAHFRADTHLVMAKLRQCRTEAISHQRPIILATRDDLAALSAPGSRDVSDNITLKVEEPVSCFADGSSSGGRIVLTRGERSKTIIVAWLTGAVTSE